MAIPDFQTLMLPLLKALADKQEHSMKDVTTTLSDQFNLSEDERNIASEVSGQPVMYNRTAWAKTYLKRAGLIEQTRRGFFRVSESGEKVLKSAPPAINIKFLRQFAEFKETQKQPEALQKDQSFPEIQTETPDELIDSGAKAIRAALSDEILQRIKGCSPAFFERLVVELLVKMGYGGSRQDAGRAIGRSGDEGIDGVIHVHRKTEQDTIIDNYLIGATDAVQNLTLLGMA